MGYLPIFVDVGGRPCLVAGGGEVAARKVAELLDARAAVTVVNPHLGSALDALARAGRIKHLARAYRRGDLRGFALIYAATDDAGLHRELAAEARELGIPLNVADAPELCSFIAPAVVRRGALQIAISTSGASPATAARLRRELEAQFGAEYAATLEILRAARVHLRRCEPDSAARAARLRALAESELPRLLRAGDIEAVDALVVRHTGAGLAALGLVASELLPSSRMEDSRQA
jgi:precorrin-2 dehydrogenase/sirohydrochlorin ferrochelatase